MDIRELCRGKIVVLDGATGSELIKAGMPQGCCPEQWVLQNPNIMEAIHADYLSTGAEIILCPSFGANQVKLGKFGLADSVGDMNRELARLTRQVVKNRAFVAGNVSSTGLFAEPFGDTSFESLIEIFKTQIRGLVDGGVDLIVIETMVDIQEARAALIAAKEHCSLPVVVSMTFSDGQTITGTTPEAAIVTLQSLGADAVGCNCSSGPEEMVQLISRMKPFAQVPLWAKANAGKPEIVNGDPIYEMNSVEFGKWVSPMASAGANLIGGCCGTTPEFVGTIAQVAKGIKPVLSTGNHFVLSSMRSVFVPTDGCLTVIGERINPTGQSELQQKLVAGDCWVVREWAEEQIAAGAAIVDVNISTPGVNEEILLTRIAQELAILNAPVSFDSTDLLALESALRVYPGRALLNSIPFQQSKLESYLQIVKKYGPAFVAMPISEKGIPHSFAERKGVITEMVAFWEAHGVRKGEYLVDCLAMSLATQERAPQEVLDTIEWCLCEQKVPTIIGLSNISHGMAAREWINAAFLALAISKGLGWAILNPLQEPVMQTLRATNVLLGKISPLSFHNS